MLKQAGAKILTLGSLTSLLCDQSLLIANSFTDHYTPTALFDSRVICHLPDAMLRGLQAALLDLPCAARELPPDIQEELREQVEEW